MHKDTPLTNIPEKDEHWTTGKDIFYDRSDNSSTEADSLSLTSNGDGDDYEGELDVETVSGPEAAHLRIIDDSIFERNQKPSLIMESTDDDDETEDVEQDDEQEEGESTMAESGVEEESNHGAVQKTPLPFPASRVRKIMKADSELKKCTSDSVLAVGLATVHTKKFY